MLLDLPRVLLLALLLLLFVADRVGSFLKQRHNLADGEREDFTLVTGSTLTLLGLIIGFTFSMAVGRYDLRKHYEEEEANAIGTEYTRAGLLPPADAAKVRGLLRSYLDYRILFYETSGNAPVQQLNATIPQLQDQLWSAVQAVVMAQPTAATALTASGMNDVLNSQGYAQAAEWNRIPEAAWILMTGIAICANLLVGYGRHTDTHALRQLVLPLIIALSFFLISDIDSPRRGVIRILPQNLKSLAQSLPR